MQSGGNLSGPSASAREGNASLGKNLVEGLPFHEFHDEIRRLRGLVNPHVVQGDDARMRKLADHARFLEKTVAACSLCQSGRKEFNGDDSPDHGIVRAHDLAVCAGADDVDNLIAAYLHGAFPSDSCCSTMEDDSEGVGYIK